MKATGKSRPKLPKMNKREQVNLSFSGFAVLAVVLAVVLMVFLIIFIGPEVLYLLWLPYILAFFLLAMVVIIRWIDKEAKR